jgi:hypothetical protein
MFTFWHDNQRIFEVCIACLLLAEPYLVESLACDASRQMCVELQLYLVLQHVIREPTDLYFWQFDVVHDFLLFLFGN